MCVVCIAMLCGGSAFLCYVDKERHVCIYICVSGSLMYGCVCVSHVWISMCVSITLMYG